MCNADCSMKLRCSAPSATQTHSAPMRSVQSRLLDKTQMLCTFVHENSISPYEICGVQTTRQLSHALHLWPRRLTRPPLSLCNGDYPIKFECSALVVTVTHSPPMRSVQCRLPHKTCVLCTFGHGDSLGTYEVCEMQITR